MFTGIIEETGTIQTVTDLDGGKEVTIAAPFSSELQVDQSISINGACHTVTECDDKTFTVQSVEETLRKTNIGGLAKDDLVNLERSMTMDRLLDGHIVQGHVDTVGTIKAIEKEGTDHLLTIAYPEEHRNLIVGRGSIAVDGISLTVAREAVPEFTVAIIPYTWEHTNLKDKQEGDTVNLEFDVLGKYVARNLEVRSEIRDT
ncbi:riboflavin synthase [Aliifodinibius sp. S!AR15-10]|uniref:riboflavin synthase n=1 Tax=Aliifodinibius sp. S!AR15-10 TaxID=2950437 RepID=UPI002866868E|nr:riboflavin synthase [Aliifodinibius sp. S!AR15-10]MDR8392691.1 riboflavin synthase [Aliifodinibius sp. S!AR15-10]